MEARRQELLQENGYWSKRMQAAEDEAQAAELADAEAAPPSKVCSACCFCASAAAALSCAVAQAAVGCHCMLSGTTNAGIIGS